MGYGSIEKLPPVVVDELEQRFALDRNDPYFEKQLAEAIGRAGGQWKSELINIQILGSIAAPDSSDGTGPRKAWLIAIYADSIVWTFMLDTNKEALPAYLLENAYTYLTKHTDAIYTPRLIRAEHRLTPLDYQIAIKHVKRPMWQGGRIGIGLGEEISTKSVWGASHYVDWWPGEGLAGAPDLTAFLGACNGLDD